MSDAGKATFNAGISTGGTVATTAMEMGGGTSSASIYRTGSDGSGLHFSTNAVLPADETGSAANGTEDLGGTSNKFKDLHLSSKVFLGGMTLTSNDAGRIGLNRNPDTGASVSSSSYQRYQINGPSSSGDFLDIQNYNSSGNYSGSLRISGGSLYVVGGADRRIKLSDSGIAGVSDSNNTVHIRGDNDSLKLNAAGNGVQIFEINGTEKLRIGDQGLGINYTSATAGKLNIVGTGSNSVVTFFQHNECFVSVTHSGNNGLNPFDITLAFETSHLRGGTVEMPVSYTHLTLPTIYSV